MIKDFVKIIERVYEESFEKSYMPEQLFVAQQLLSIINQLAEQHEETLFVEFPVETVDCVVNKLKKVHYAEDIIEMLEVNIEELEDEISRRRD